MKLFAQLTKVDAAAGMIFGRMTQELPDSAGEILDYESSKPNFQKWSEEFAQATGGLSKGNVRAMHGQVAVGKLTEIDYLDEEKAIDFAAKIVDRAELEKCIEGVYTGISIGGSYAKRWQDGEFTRFTALPKEVSLVDNPCLKTARYTLVKVDGSVAEMSFSKDADGFKSDEERKAAFAAMGGGDKGSDKAQEASQKANEKSAEAANAHNQAMKIHHKEGNEKAAAYHRDARNMHQAEATKAIAAIKLEIASCEEDLVKLHKREFSDEERQDLADKGHALPDGSFPIVNREDLENAVHAYGRAKDKAKAKAHIISRAKDLKATDLLPADWEGSTKEEKAALAGMLRKIDLGAALAKYVGEEINDALTALNAASSLICLFSRENQQGEPPEQLKSLKAAVDALKVFIISEMGEDSLSEGGGAGAPMFMMAKAGARHSAGDLERIQGIHDHSVALGADCKGAEKSEVIEMQKVEIEKLIEERLGKVEEAHKADLAKLEAANTEVLGKKDEEIGTLRKDLESLQAKLAEIPKPGGPALRVVSKAQDLGQDDPAAKVEPIKKADGTVDAHATALAQTKAAMEKPFIIGRP